MMTQSEFIRFIELAGFSAAPETYKGNRYQKRGTNRVYEVTKTGVRFSSITRSRYTQGKVTAWSRISESAGKLVVAEVPTEYFICELLETGMHAVPWLELLTKSELLKKKKSCKDSENQLGCHLRSVEVIRDLGKLSLVEAQKIRIELP